MISVVIPSYGQVYDLSLTLRALAEQTYSDFEVVVVHSGPGKPMMSCPAPSHLSVQFVFEKRRLFPGAARNLGVRKSTGNLFAFLNLNVHPYSCWLEKLVKKHEEFPLACVVGSVHLDSYENFWQVCLWLSEFTGVHSYSPSSDNYEHGVGSNIFISRELFEKVSGFPSNYRAAEDVIFLCKIKSLGRTVAFATEARVCYKNPSVSFGHLTRHSFMLGQWSAAARLRGYGIKAKASSLLIVCPFLGAVRLVRFIQGLTRAAQPALRNVWYVPGVAIAFFYWNLGFLRGRILLKNKF